MVELSKLTRIDEARYSRRQDLEFSIRNRRNRLIGLWAAERMHLGAAAATAYAGDVVGDGVIRPQDEALIGRLSHDLAGAGVPLSEDELRGELQRLGQVAAMEFGETAPERPCAA